jgi:hypothetical protein
VRPTFLAHRISARVNLRLQHLKFQPRNLYNEKTVKTRKKKLTNILTSLDDSRLAAGEYVLGGEKVGLGRVLLVAPRAQKAESSIYSLALALQIDGLRVVHSIQQICQ